MHMIIDVVPSETIPHVNKKSKLFPQLLVLKQLLLSNAIAHITTVHPSIVIIAMKWKTIELITMHEFLQLTKVKKNY